MSSDVNDSSITITCQKTGLYRGLNIPVTLISKLIITLLVVFAVALPDRAVALLTTINQTMLEHFNLYYVYAVAFYLVFCTVLCVSPLGRKRLGRDDEVPEFSRFAWFSMMFGAGMGIGLLFYSIGEPVSHFNFNPDIAAGKVQAGSEQAIESAVSYTFLHWGLHAWAIYASVALALGYFAYRRGLPLTIRSTLMPIFGKRLLDGPLGHAVDIIAVVATTLGVATTMGAGVSQLVAGLDFVMPGTELLDSAGIPRPWPLILTLVVIMGLSTLSAVTGVKRGVNWLSQFNMLLSFALLAVFIWFGSRLFASELLVSATWDYLRTLPERSFQTWPVTSALGQWQVDWTILQRAWFIAFAPFVGLFLARISRGRTIREFVLGAVVAPSLMCFVWICYMGGSSLHMETSGLAQGTILATVRDHIATVLFVTLDYLDTGALIHVIVGGTLILIITYLVTSADSGVLVLNAIMAGGEETNERRHRIIWGALLTLVVGSLLLAGGLAAIQKAMLIASLPFSLLMILMCIATFMSLWREPSDLPAVNEAEPT